MAFSLLSLLGVITAAPSLIAGQDAPEILESCVACHGENGVSMNPLVPTLAGQPFTLIEDNLLAFRSGKRVCSPEWKDNSPSALLASTMCQSVSRLSNAEIAVLAEHFEQQQFQPASQSFDPSLANKGMAVHRDKGCEHCHSGGGTVSNSMAPLLAGQWMPYLRRALDAVYHGSRKGPSVMNEAIAGLERAELEALVHFYASPENKEPE